jgi:hypothetical protein
MGPAHGELQGYVSRHDEHGGDLLLFIIFIQFDYTHYSIPKGRVLDSMDIASYTPAGWDVRHAPADLCAPDLQRAEPVENVRCAGIFYHPGFNIFNTGRPAKVIKHHLCDAMLSYPIDEYFTGEGINVFIFRFGGYKCAS